MNLRDFRYARPVALAVCLVGALACQPAAPDSAASVDPASNEEIAALRAEVQVLKDKATSASVAMADVSFHWANLWFAGERENWPLANYYYSEARNHVRWLIRINPMPKGPDGGLVDLQGIFEAIDTSTFAEVKAAIDGQDRTRFAAAYRAALESCYSCHKAVGRPYLRPQIPETVPQTIVNMDPAATWPQ